MELLLLLLLLLLSLLLLLLFSYYYHSPFLQPLGAFVVQLKVPLSIL